jgi:hypothetical protein
MPRRAQAFAGSAMTRRVLRRLEEAGLDVASSTIEATVRQPRQREGGNADAGTG